MTAPDTPRGVPLTPCTDPECGKIHVTHRGGRACQKHKKRRAPDGSKVPCTNDPMRGQDCCRMHGGSTPSARTKAAQRLEREAVAREAAKLGIGQGRIDGDTAESMLEAHAKARWNVSVLEAAIANLRPELGDHDELDAVALQLVSWTDAGRTVRLTPHTLIEMYNDERDRMVKYAEMCRRLGAQERMNEISAEHGRQLIDVLTASRVALFALLVSEAQAGRLSVERLRAIEATEAPALVAAEVARVRAGQEAA